MLTKFMFDTTFLEKSSFDFVVISDTHYMRIPPGTRLEFENHGKQGARSKAALQMAASVESAFVLHLGDKCQAYPGTEQFYTAMDEAIVQMGECGFKKLYHVAGNQDIGDKHDPTMPTKHTSQELLDWYHSKFGPSWYSFAHQDCVFVVLNSMILNASLPDAAKQQEWLEGELPKHKGKRIFLFLHIPLYLWNTTEASLGHYENIDEPARGWLLKLISEYSMQAVLSGHVHFSFFDHFEKTRVFVMCSTSFTRTGYSYVMPSAPPPQRGRDDTPKLGFYLYRVFPNRTDIHFIRTSGSEAPPSKKLLVTKVLSSYTTSALGITFRSPLTPTTEIPISWPSSIRERIRNDYPLLLCLEMGVKHARVPASDVLDSFHRERGNIFRREGAELTAMVLWPDKTTLSALLLQKNHFDRLELQLTQQFFPDSECLKELKSLRQQYQGPVALSVIQSGIREGGKGFPQHRLGYHASELKPLNEILEKAGIEIDQAIVRINSNELPHEVIQNVPSHLSKIKSFDFLVELCSTDEVRNMNHAGEAFFCASFRENSHVFFDPLTDLDRSMTVTYGILDSLSNPRAVSHVLRHLNTILSNFKNKSEARLEVKDSENLRMIRAATKNQWCQLILPMSDKDNKLDLSTLLTDKASVRWMDLIHGNSEASSSPGLICFRGPVLLCSA
jgi:hypothetical protein